MRKNKAKQKNPPIFVFRQTTWCKGLFKTKNKQIQNQPKQTKPQTKKTQQKAKQKKPTLKETSLL